MNELVGNILDMCFPRQMPLGYTGQVSLAAGVGSFMIWRRWRAMSGLTYHARNSSRFALEPHSSYAVAANHIWPHQAFITFVAKELLQEFLGLVARCFHCFLYVRTIRK